MNESGERQIPLSGSDITEKEKKAVLNVLESPYLSLGPRLPEFEEKMSSFIGTKHAVAVNSGTSALHLIVRALGIGAGDEVITTPFSFIASANCILFENARPVFVDIDKRTLNIDPDLIEERITKKTKAILAVDVFGHPAEWDKLEKIAEKHGLKLIEDSCEAIGAEYKGRKAGSFGSAGTFAFYPNKQITTGEGGMIVTNDGKIAEFCESSRNQGRSIGTAWLRHERLGYNYRLSDINCALGTCQLERINEILGKRDRVAAVYGDLLKNVEEIELPYAREDVKMSWFVYVVKLKKEFTEIQRDDIIKRLKQSGIGCSNYFSPIHLQPFYKKEFGYKKGDYPVTESVSERTIALPFYSNLKDEDIKRVVQTLKKIISDVL
ncbi:MAG: DegT/DnrJ/EryC1/StrS family aminotransferase [Candidatus Omnitrophica bacterium]|nr:DegT/DnrJ/EryC1/StrS family aminotransferase [Candidatus Omnitrophota bacterium]